MFKFKTQRPRRNLIRAKRLHLFSNGDSHEGRHNILGSISGRFLALKCLKFFRSNRNWIEPDLSPDRGFQNAGRVPYPSTDPNVKMDRFVEYAAVP